MKIMISMDEDLIKKVDEYADRNYTTRSGVITLGVNNILFQDECNHALNKLALAMERIADNDNKIDSQSKKDLDDLKALARLLGAQGG